MAEHRDTATAVEPDWRDRLDALVRGECSEDDFMDEVSAYSEAVPDSAWSVVALLDQHYRRGQVPVDLFKSIESRIARRELHVPAARRAAPLSPTLPSPLSPTLPSPLSPTAAPRRSQRRYPVDFWALRARAGLTQRVEPASPPLLYRMHTHIDAPDLDAAASAQTQAHAQAQLPASARSTEAAAPVDAVATTRVAPVAGDVLAAKGPGAELAIGQVLRDRYVIEGRLASGGMGTVYKALDLVRREHSEVESYVAIKVLHDSARGTPAAVAKLRREFYCAQSLSHRSVVKVFEIDRAGDLDFFSMEYLEGKPLSALLEESHPRPITRERAWAVIREIASGLAHAHTRNIVHADLKPQNVMLLASGDLRILDFGASSGVARQSGRPTGLTPAYASCELLEGQAADARDDLFALACLAFELLGGRHPFDYLRATEARKFDLQPQRPEGLTHRQWRALESGLAWQREKRAPGVREWVAELLPRPSPWIDAPRGLATRALALLNARLAGDKAGAYLVGTLVLAVAAVAAIAVAHRPLPELNAEVAALAKPAPSDQNVAAELNPEVAALPSLPSGAKRVSPDTGAVVTPGVAARMPAKAPAPAHWTTPAASAAVAPAPSTPSAAPLPVAAAPLTVESAATAPGRAVRTKAVSGKVVPGIAVPGNALPTKVAAIPAARPVRSAAVDLKVDKISMASSSYRVPANAKFVEVHVRRSAASADAASFMWWTQSGTAVAGTDFVPQGRAAVTFAPGKLSATVYVKLTPDTVRQHAGTFNVMIGEAGGGATLGPVTRSAIVLAPR